MSEHKDLTGSALHADASGIRVRDGQLTDGQIKALPTTPVELVPAPGTGLMLLFHRALLLADFSGGGYTNVSVSADPTLGGGLNINFGTVLLNEMAASVYSLAIGSTGHWFTDFVPGTTALSSGYVITSSFDDPTPYGEFGLTLVAWNPDGNFTGGNAANTLSVRVWYSIVPAVPFGAS